MGFLDFLMGMGGNNGAVNEYLEKGAVVIDVRTPAEYQGGHVSGSKNYPLNLIREKISELKALKKPLILCCASGARSGSATQILQAKGIDCVNGGSWMSVNGLVEA